MVTFNRVDDVKGTEINDQSESHLCCFQENMVQLLKLKYEITCLSIFHGWVAV